MDDVVRPARTVFVRLTLVLHWIPHVLISQSLERRTLLIMSLVSLRRVFGVSVSATKCHHLASVKSLSNRVMPEQVTDLREETGIAKVYVMFEREQQDAIHFTKTASIRYKGNERRTRIQWP